MHDDPHVTIIVVLDVAAAIDRFYAARHFDFCDNFDVRARRLCSLLHLATNKNKVCHCDSQASSSQLSIDRALANLLCRSRMNQSISGQCFLSHSTSHTNGSLTEHPIAYDNCAAVGERHAQTTMPRTRLQSAGSHVDNFDALRRRRERRWRRSAAAALAPQRCGRLSGDGRRRQPKATTKIAIAKLRVLNVFQLVLRNKFEIANFLRTLSKIKHFIITDCRHKRKQC